MEPILIRVSENLVARITGPMKFRLLMQPATALFLAIRDGLRDARAGKRAYFWRAFADRGDRDAMLKEGWKSIGKVFIFAVVLDMVYQIIETRWVYPGEAVIVAIILAIIPYVLFRGPANRIAQLFRRQTKEQLSETRD